MNRRLIIQYFRANGTSTNHEIATPPRTRQPNFAIRAISFGLIFAAADLLYGISTDLRSPLATFDFYFVPLVLGFVILSLIAAFLTILKRRAGYLLAAVVSLGFVLPSIPVFIPTLSNPVNFETYVIALTSVPLLTLVAFFSILSFLSKMNWIEQKKSLETPKSLGGAVSGVFLILIAAGVVNGAYQPNIIGATQVHVSIVHGAGAPTTLHSFSPDNITVEIGVNNTITFTNNDLTVHTVTDKGGTFNSGLLNEGDKFTLTLSKPGTYNYYCIIHQGMVGTIVVKAAA